MSQEAAAEAWTLEADAAELRELCATYSDLLDQAENVRQDRDVFILALLEHGLTQVEVARMADLSRSQVIRIVAREGR